MDGSDLLTAEKESRGRAAAAVHRRRTRRKGPCCAWTGWRGGACSVSRGPGNFAASTPSAPSAFAQPPKGRARFAARPPSALCGDVTRCGAMLPPSLNGLRRRAPAAPRGAQRGGGGGGGWAPWLVSRRACRLRMRAKTGECVPVRRPQSRSLGREFWGALAARGSRGWARHARRHKRHGRLLSGRLLGQRLETKEHGPPRTLHQRPPRHQWLKTGYGRWNSTLEPDVAQPSARSAQTHLIATHGCTRRESLHKRRQGPRARRSGGVRPKSRPYDKPEAQTRSRSRGRRGSKADRRHPSPS